MTFKVGDRVRVISKEYGKSQFGKTGVVEEVGRSSRLDVQIVYDEPLDGIGLKRNQYRSEHLELFGPIRTETVTTRRLEPGVYGPLHVTREAVMPLRCGEDAPEEPVVYAAIIPSYLSASEWRELARVALEIAEYLDAQ